MQEVAARGKAVIPTDLKVAVPHGTYGRVAPRSGLAAKNFIDVGAGVVDEDYRGPLGVVLFNHAEVPYQVKQGDRIAQVTSAQCLRAFFLLLLVRHLRLDRRAFFFEFNCFAVINRKLIVNQGARDRPWWPSSLRRYLKFK